MSHDTLSRLTRGLRPRARRLVCIAVLAFVPLLVGHEPVEASSSSAEDQRMPRHGVVCGVMGGSGQRIACSLRAPFTIPTELVSSLHPSSAWLRFPEPRSFE